MGTLVENISLNDDGFSEGIKEAIEKIKELNEETGAAGNEFKNMRKTLNTQKREVMGLTAVYNGLSDAMKQSEYGQKLAKQIEDASNEYRKLKENVNMAEEAIKSLDEEAKKNSDIKIGVDVDTKKLSMRDVASELLKGFNMPKLGASVEVGGLTGLAKGAGAAAMGIGVAVAATKKFIDVSTKAIGLSAQFGKGLSELGAITGLQGKELEDTRKQILQQAKDSKTAATEITSNYAKIGGAMPELLEMPKQLGEVSQNAITLSRAGLMPLNDATESLTTTLNSFNLGAEQSGRAIDILAGASQAGAAEIRDISESLVNIGPSAQIAGLGLNETAALIEVLASKSIKGAEAGTQLRNIFTTMSTAGIDEINPKIVGVQTALENLSQRAGDSKFMVDTFGRANSNAATTIASALPMYNELISQLDKVGVAEQMAATNTDNLATRWEQTMTMWDNVLTQFDVDSSQTLGSSIQGIQDIITQVDEAIGLISQTEGFAELDGMVSDIIDTASQGIESIIGILGDVIAAISDIFDAVTDVTFADEILAGAWAGVQEAVKVVEAAVWLVSKAVREVIGVVRTLFNNLKQGVSKIPFFDKLKEGLKEIKRFIDQIIGAWNALKKAVGAAMARDRQQRQENNNNNETTTTTTTTNTNDDNNNGGGTGTGNKNKNKNKTKQETPKEKYDAKQAQIKALRQLGFYNLESTTGNTKKALEEQIKATESYIGELTKNEASVKKNEKLVRQLTSRLQSMRNELRTVTVDYNDEQDVENASREYADTLRILNRNFREGLITREEYEKDYEQALNGLVGTMKGVHNASKELIDAMRKRQNELKDAAQRKEIDAFYKDFSKAQKQVEGILNRDSEGRIDRTQRQPAPNSYRVEVENLEYDAKKLLDDMNVSISVAAEFSGFEQDVDKELEYIKENKNTIIDLGLNINPEDLNTVLNMKKYLGSTSEDIMAFERVAEHLYDAPTEKLKEYNNFVRENRKLLRNAYQEFENLEQYDKMVRVWDIKAKFENEGMGVLGVTELMKDANIDLKPELNEEEFEALRHRVMEENFEIGVDLSASIDSIKEVRQQLSDIGIDASLIEGFDEVDEKIKNDTKRYQEFFDVVNSGYDSLYQGRGDASNFTLKNISYERLNNREQYGYKNSIGRYEGWQNTTNIEKEQKEMDTLMAKYKDVEQILIELNRQRDEIKNQGFGNNEDNNTLLYNGYSKELEDLEKEIDSMHDKIQRHLTFEVRLNGLRDALSSLQGLAGYGNMWANFDEDWKRAEESANGAAVAFEHFIHIISIAQSTMDAYDTTMNLINGIIDLFSKKSITAAAGQQASAIATTEQAAAETAAIAPKLSLAATQKALEASTLELAAAQIFAAHAAIPFAGVGIGAGEVATMMGTMTATKASIKALAAYAEGGILHGGSPHGDTGYFRANDGEMILNTHQQANLFDMIEHGTGGIVTGDVNFRIENDALVGTLKNANKTAKMKGKSINILS